MTATRKRLFFAFLTLVVVLLAGFFVYKQVFKESPKVIVVIKEEDTEFWEIIKAGVEKGFEDFGIDGKILAPKNGTPEEQMEILDQALKENPDLLIVAPLGSDIIPKLEKYNDKNIPVLLMDSNAPWEHKTAYIGTDNLILGVKAGILMASELQPGEKVALIGRRRSFAEADRLIGAKKSLEAAGIQVAVEYGDLKVGNKDVQEVKRIMDDIIKEYPDLKGVITTSDSLALPALKSIQEHGLEIPVTGTDGISEMLKYIRDEKLSISVSQNPYDMGYLSVETADKVLKGKKVKKNIDSGVDIITKSNAEQRLEFYAHILE
ncbi:sugar ABC transporter substrate-binding protein [Niallia oryzisoli]|uniref:Sugar ABC transporter substrate-binding protein n=1 Tax=Niallia oryzisoli TaxID=1737571 RepID=A0ABZ2CI26_9BACI